MSTTQVVRANLQVQEARSLLLERMGVLLRRACRSLGAGLARSRKQAGRRGPAAMGGLFTLLMSRVLTSKHAHSRMLAVQERLTLGPKQHMYLVRCGEQQLLVASAGEGALQWMVLPEATGSGEVELRPAAQARPTLTTNATVAENSVLKAVSRQRTTASRTKTKSVKSSASRKNGSEVAR